MIYCVIPRELEGELFDKMVEYYKDNPNVTVIVDRREGNDRRERQPSPEIQEQAQDARPPPATGIRGRSRTPTRLPTTDRYSRLHGDDGDEDLQELHRRRVGGRRLRRDLREP